MFKKNYNIYTWTEFTLLTLDNVDESISLILNTEDYLDQINKQLDNDLENSLENNLDKNKNIIEKKINFNSIAKQNKIVIKEDNGFNNKANNSFNNDSHNSDKDFNYYRKLLSDKELITYITISNNLVTGLVSFRIIDNQAQLELFYLNSYFIGSGLAQLLIYNLKIELKKRSLESVVIKFNKDKLRAYNFFYAQGWKEIDHNQLYIFKSQLIKDNKDKII